MEERPQATRSPTGTLCFDMSVVAILCLSGVFRSTEREFDVVERDRSMDCHVPVYMAPSVPRRVLALPASTSQLWQAKRQNHKSEGVVISVPGKAISDCHLMDFDINDNLEAISR